MYQCCFCAETVTEHPLTLVIVATDREHDESTLRQTITTHPACLAARLDPSMPFEAELFIE
jgi:hypothetical protein